LIEEGMDFADVPSNIIGTLAETIVSQRTLESFACRQESADMNMVFVLVHGPHSLLKAIDEASHISRQISGWRRTFRSA
jgi:hypothetical protein